MSWTAGMYFTKKEEEATRQFLTAQGLDDRQIITIEMFVRQKVVSAVYLYSSLGAGLAVIAFTLGFLLSR